ncbi:MAG: hypothetical protein QNJ42_16780 [Crocosphaera sp.]|nr:hypothetical protein [Crocosphaera sp.]
MLEKFNEVIFWLFFNVILALLPLLVNLLLIFLIPHQERQQWKWIALVKEGELFFFSSTLAAIEIGDIFQNNNLSQSTESELVSTFTLISLLLVLLLSSIIFGCSALMKIQGQLSGSRYPYLFDEEKFAIGSITCAIMAIILSLIAFIHDRVINIKKSFVELRIMIELTNLPNYLKNDANHQTMESFKELKNYPTYDDKAIKYCFDNLKKIVQGYPRFQEIIESIKKYINIDV